MFRQLLEMERERERFVSSLVGAFNPVNHRGIQSEKRREKRDWAGGLEVVIERNLRPDNVVSRYHLL